MQPRRNQLATLTVDQVASRLHEKSFYVFDCNPKAEFAKGHVPGARNHPFAINLDARGRFLDAAALERRWAERLRGRGAAEVIAMCGSGVTACHNLLALEVAGLPGARLYAGSWSEWIRDPARPVARGPEAPAGAGAAAQAAAAPPNTRTS